MAEALEERYGSALREGEGFRVAGHRIGDRLFVSVRLLDTQHEVSLTLEAQLVVPDFPGLQAARMCAYDTLDSLLGGYFEDERVRFFPVEWSTASFGEHEVAFRGRLQRTALERAADDLLARGQPASRSGDPASR